MAALASAESSPPAAKARRFVRRLLRAWTAASNASRALRRASSSAFVAPRSDSPRRSCSQPRRPGNDRMATAGSAVWATVQQRNPFPRLVRSALPHERGPEPSGSRRDSMGRRHDRSSFTSATSSFHCSRKSGEDFDMAARRRSRDPSGEVAGLRISRSILTPCTRALGAWRRSGVPMGTAVRCTERFSGYFHPCAQALPPWYGLATTSPGFAVARASGCLAGRGGAFRWPILRLISTPCLDGLFRRLTSNSHITVGD